MIPPSGKTDKQSMATAVSHARLRLYRPFHVPRQRQSLRLKPVPHDLCTWIVYTRNIYLRCLYLTNMLLVNDSYARVILYPFAGIVKAVLDFKLLILFHI